MAGILIAGKEKIPLQFRIGVTCFTSIYIIGGKIYINHTKNVNHVHKYSKDLVPVIITTETNVSGGETLFYDGKKYTDLGKRAHVLKNKNGRILIGPFERCFY